MIRRSLLSPLLCGLLLLAGPNGASADEPFLRFLDDIGLAERHGPERDPYEERIETERHDFTQSTVTVGRGVFQIEGGYTFFYKDHEDEIETSHSLPEMLLRYGVSEDIEVRMKTDYIWRFVDEADNVDGAEDLQLAVKLGMTEQECLIPESALELGITVPTGGSAWTTERVQFGLDYIYGWELTEGLTLYGSTGMFENAAGDFGLLPEEPAADRFVVMSQSAAVGVDLSPSSTMYLEYYGLFSSGLDDNLSVGIFNIGVDFYATDNLVFDIRSGVGLTDDSDDFFFGVGGGYRF
ncbi:hypothetical protein Mal4_18380 [Maioricimonas rarisocia]|uniref:MetA-pathway of phenol degradation n=1 Tax=Maioricimonas rarisocia TaxID=2528026 RepID=A0A517Z4Z3_9PLAN|nr:transporter [Maioricimonas rarisocia]QDU37524.1 hypothetical protein Mal4_18380 [Maioricimonas rarisocia]